jgi:hypothetical protein
MLNCGGLEPSIFGALEESQVHKVADIHLHTTDSAKTITVGPLRDEASAGDGWL